MATPREDTEAAAVAVAEDMEECPSAPAVVAAADSRPSVEADSEVCVEGNVVTRGMFKGHLWWSDGVCFLTW